MFLTKKTDFTVVLLLASQGCQLEELDQAWLVLDLGQTTIVCQPCALLTALAITV
jgi:hypothetical protein